MSQMVSMVFPSRRDDADAAIVHLAAMNPSDHHPRSPLDWVTRSPVHQVTKNPAHTSETRYGPELWAMADACGCPRRATQSALGVKPDLLN